MMKMSRINERIWRLNQEYVRRLANARTVLGLLESLLTSNLATYGLDDGWSTTEAEWTVLLRDAADALNQLHEAHRTWRYDYFYESPDTRRVVQDRAAVAKATVYFEHLLRAYESRLELVSRMLRVLPRPDPHWTTVPQGDLWSLFETAVDDLRSFKHEISVI
jgi:hypothetical protein